MRQVNMKVNNTLELRQKIEVWEAKLKAHKADVNAWAVRVNAQAAYLENIVSVQATMPQ